MKKFLFLHILAIILMLPYPAKAMFAKFTQISAYLPRIWQNTRLYSKPSIPKSLTTLSFSEVEKLAYNKELAHKELKSALFRHEDTKPKQPLKNLGTKIFGQFSIFNKSSLCITSLWKKTLSQFSIQDWNSMLLAREEDTVLRTIHPHLPYSIKTTNEELDERINKAHIQVKQFYNARPLDESLQQYYQERLEAAGYSKIPTIYQWDNDKYGTIISIRPHAYVTSDFFNLPLDEQLGVLAHEHEHTKNFHRHKQDNICSFLDERNIPNTYFQFTEKEADLKACAHGLAIATGLLNHFKRWEKEEPLKNACSIINNTQQTHPSDSERVNYIQDLIDKLEQEQKGYAWNPFYKILGLTEWFKRC